MATGDLTLRGEHTMQYTDVVLQNYTLESYIILLTNVIPINLMPFFFFLSHEPGEFSLTARERSAPKHFKGTERSKNKIVF